MKKSRILAPAFAVIALGTAAAVTGTVAWYFAQTKVTIKSSAVTSFNPQPGLKVTLSTATGNGTVIPSGKAVSTGTTPAEVEHELMRDASVDMSYADGPKVYAANLGRTSTAANPVVESYREVSTLKDGTYDAPVFDDNGDPVIDPVTNEQETEPKDFYFATVYSAKFELTKIHGKHYALYYDNAALTVSGSSAVQASLRIGFRINDNESGNLQQYFVVAPFRDADGGAYVEGTAKTAVGNYETNDHMLYGYKTKLTSTVVNEETIYTAELDSTTPKTDNLKDLGTTVSDADKDSFAGYMGDVYMRENTDPAYTGTITATVYTWFEGEDAHSRSMYVDEEPLQTMLSFTIAEII